MSKYLLTNDSIQTNLWEMLETNDSYSEDLSTIIKVGKAAVDTLFRAEPGTNNSTSGDFNALSSDRLGWRTDSTLSGDFSSGNWTFKVRFESNTRYGFSIKVACRLSRSTSSTGADATEIAVSESPNTIAIPGTSGGSVTDTWTWNCSGLTLVGEYLFAEYRIKITKAATNATAACSFACDEDPSTADESVETTTFASGVTEAGSSTLALAPKAAIEIKFHEDKTGLAEGTTYYYRAKAYTDGTWWYSAVESFTTVSIAFLGQANLALAPIASRLSIVQRITSATLALTSTGSKIWESFKSASKSLALTGVSTLYASKNAVSSLALTAAGFRLAQTIKTAQNSLSLTSVGSHLFGALEDAAKALALVPAAFRGVTTLRATATNFALHAYGWVSAGAFEAFANLALVPLGSFRTPNITKVGSAFAALAPLGSRITAAGRSATDYLVLAPVASIGGGIYYAASKALGLAGAGSITVASTFIGCVNLALAPAAYINKELLRLGQATASLVPTAKFNLGKLQEALANLALAPAAYIGKELLRLGQAATSLVPTAKINLGTLKEALANLALAPVASVSKSFYRTASKALELVGAGSIVGIGEFIGYAKLALTSIGHVGVSGTRAAAATLALVPRAWQFVNLVEAFCVMGANTLRSYIAAPGRQLFLSLVAEKAKALIAKTWDTWRPGPQAAPFGIKYGVGELIINGAGHAYHNDTLI
jgi:hypothetical protein